MHIQTETFIGILNPLRTTEQTSEEIFHNSFKNSLLAYHPTHCISFQLYFSPKRIPLHCIYIQPAVPNHVQFLFIFFLCNSPLSKLSFYSSYCDSGQKCIRSLENTDEDQLQQRAGYSWESVTVSTFPSPMMSSTSFELVTKQHTRWLHGKHSVCLCAR